MQAKLSAGGDDAWKDREAAVLALGAIGEGCINGLYPHLLEVFSFFFFWALITQSKRNGFISGKIVQLVLKI